MRSPTDSTNSKWRTLLIPVRKGNLDRVSTLLQDNPDIASTPSPHSLLHNAVDSASNCNLLLRELLVSGVPPDTKNSASVCALHHAARNGCLACVRQLLDAGAQPDACDSHDQTPLHYAVSSSRGGSAACIQLLLERSSSVDVSCEAGLSPLHVAAQVGNVGAAKLLLDAGASVASRDRNGCTPLHLATTSGVVEVLLAAGADVTAQNNSLQTPLERTIEFYPTVAQTLLDAGVEVRGNPQEKDLRVFFHLNTVTGGSSPCDVDLLYNMTKCGRNDLLKHPLCQVFLHLKWYHVRPIFYTSLLIRGVMVAAFSTFLTLHPHFPCNQTDDANNFKVSQEISVWINATKVLSAVLLSLVVLGSVIQVLALGVTFVRRPCVWISLSFAVSSITVIVTDCQAGQWGQHLGVLALLTGWGNVTFLLSLTPSIGIYLQMFIAVSLRMIKFIFVFIPLFLGFAAAFSLTFESEFFGSPLKAILKTLAMMVGDVAFNDIFTEDYSNGMRELIYILYLLLMTITATNLLVGLVIEDIQVLMAEASANRLALTVNVEMYIDEFFNSSIFANSLQRLKDLTSFLSNLAVKPLTLSREVSISEAPMEFAHHDRRKAQKEADKYFNVFVCPNRSKKPGKVFRNLMPAEHSSEDYDERPAGYTLPKWIVRDIKDLIASDRFRRKEEEAAKWRLGGHSS